jgi:hypothetical protein
MTDTNVDVIFCINIYKCLQTLEKQIISIEENVLCSYKIILSCNDYMFNELKNKQLSNNVLINPEIMNKIYHHGSITNGIVSNMEYAKKINLNYKYCIILSGRTVFYTKMNITDLDKLNKRWDNIEDRDIVQKGDFPYMNWHWPQYKCTLLAKYYLDKGYILFGCAHEGLCFSYNVVNNILNFLDDHLEIKNDIFNYNFILEEFALQTISAIEVNPSNLEYGYFNISHGTGDGFTNHSENNLYVYKIGFEC